MTDTHDQHPSADQKKPDSAERTKKKEERSMELGEEAAHAIGSRRENLIDKAKQESP